MKLRTKISLTSLGLAAALVVSLTLLSLYSFREYSIHTASEHVRTAAEIVRVHLTESMIHGTIDRRDGFLARLSVVEGFRSARVARSPLLEAQFGSGKGVDEAPDAVELEVMKTGRPVYMLDETSGETLFRGTIPYIATTQGSPNCLSCHQVEEGAVLGTVTLSLSIDHLKRRTLFTVAWMSLAVLLFALLAVWTLRRMICPISDTARDVEQAVNLAIQGNFDTVVQQRTDDEIGHIARDLNQLLRTIGDSLGRIAESVSHLIQRKPVPGENQINATIEMVDILARAARFKQAIEEDETRGEIHQRLNQVLKNEFFLNEFTLYEVIEGKNQMAPILVDGEPASDCCWCNPEIMVRSDACRARRTGHVVDGVGNPGLCYAFQPPEGETGRGHVCLPILQSGTVGNVLQIVTTPDNQALVAMLVPFISVYLGEAAPVLESKRLMETLREANLRDPMTGLNNRRFLEEYVETLVAGSQRRKTNLVILMLDLDYFKMVNDTFGHDAGDTVLKALAKTLRQSVRAADMVIRYGGEEFMILLQDTAVEDGLKVAETIRRAVEQLKVPVGGGTVLQKTISIGVAGFPEDSPTFWQAVKFADIALYQAKEGGRNRVVRFAPEMWDGGDKEY